MPLNLHSCEDAIILHNGAIGSFLNRCLRGGAGSPCSEPHCLASDPAPTLLSCVTPSKSFPSSVAGFPHFYNEDMAPASGEAGGE